MSRWIDADALTKEIKQDIADEGLTERYVFYRINDAPSIDIAHCGECKHCSLDVCVERTVSGKERCINICNRHSTEWVVDKDWFCADAERKESE